MCCGYLGAMEKKCKEVHANVLEVQTTYRFVLKRLNQVVQNSSGPSCTCGSAAQLQNCLSEIETLSSRIHTLEEEDKQMDKVLTVSLEQMKGLQNTYEQLKLSIQSDNVKLQTSLPSSDLDQQTSDEKTLNAAESKEGMGKTVAVEDMSTANVTDDTEADSSVDADSCGTSIKYINTASVIDDNGSENTCETVSSGTTVQYTNTASETNDTETTCISNNDENQTKRSVKFNEKVTQKLLQAETKGVTSGICEGGGSDANASDVVEVGLNDTLLGATGATRKILKPKSRIHNKSKQASDILIHSTDEPNTKPNVISDRPEVVVQTEMKSYDNLSEWEHLSAVELQAAWDAGLLSLNGVHSILLIDISESMVPVWDQVTQFFNDYISGLEAAVPKTDFQNAEHVAIVTFGHETKVQMRLTNKFADLRQCFKRLKLGGPSPMYGGISMAHVAVGASDCQAVQVNDIPQLSKVILITDGYPTQPTLFAGPDKPDEDDAKAGREQMIKTFEDFGDGHYDLYVVPVRNADMEFLNKLTSVKCGKMLDYKSGYQLSRRFYLMYKTLPISLSLGFPVLTDGGHLTEADREDLKEIKERMEKAGNTSYNEVTGSNLPIIGSRVRRGLDWEYDDQDSGGPGTIVGHTEGAKKCFVNWDLNGTIDVYKYGEDGKYDIILVDEQRYLQPGEYIAVGCIVRPGVSWKSSFDDISNEDLRGVVLRLTLETGDIPKALVRWQNGKRGLYTYVVDQNPEIVVCYDVLQHHPPQPVRKKTTRNKNKNVR